MLQLNDTKNLKISIAKSYHHCVDGRHQDHDTELDIRKGRDSRSRHKESISGAVMLPNGYDDPGEAVEHMSLQIGKGACDFRPTTCNGGLLRMGKDRDDNDCQTFELATNAQVGDYDVGMVEPRTPSGDLIAHVYFAVVIGAIPDMWGGLLAGVQIAKAGGTVSELVVLMKDGHKPAGRVIDVDGIKSHLPDILAIVLAMSHVQRVAVYKAMPDLIGGSVADTQSAGNGEKVLVLVDLICIGHMPVGRSMLQVGGVNHDPNVILAIGDSMSHVQRMLNIHIAIPDLNGGMLAFLIIAKHG